MKKEDARILKTKEKLFTAFRELLSQKTFEDITINEVCCRAGVRRATFYKHFSDKYNFLAGLCSELRKKFDKTIWQEDIRTDSDPKEYYIEYFKAMIDFFEKNSDLVKLIFKSNLTESLISVIVEENYVCTKEQLETDTKKGLNLIASADTVAIYLAGGISHIAIKWLKKDDASSKDELISEITSLIYAVFKN